MAMSLGGLILTQACNVLQNSLLRNLKLAPRYVLVVSLIFYMLWQMLNSDFRVGVSPWSGNQLGSVDPRDPCNFSYKLYV